MYGLRTDDKMLHGNIYNMRGFARTILGAAVQFSGEVFCGGSHGDGDALRNSLQVSLSARCSWLCGIFFLVGGKRHCLEGQGNLVRVLINSITPVVTPSYPYYSP